MQECGHQTKRRRKQKNEQKNIKGRKRSGIIPRRAGRDGATPFKICLEGKTAPRPDLGKNSYGGSNSSDRPDQPFVDVGPIQGATIATFQVQNSRQQDPDGDDALKQRWRQTKPIVSWTQSTMAIQTSTRQRVAQKDGEATKKRSETEEHVWWSRGRAVYNREELPSVTYLQWWFWRILYFLSATEIARTTATSETSDFIDQRLHSAKMCFCWCWPWT